MIAVYVSVIIITIVISVLLIRTFRFKADYQPQKQKTVDFDQEHAIESLQAMIRFKTVAHVDPTKIDPVPFEGFIEYLKTRYPKIIQHAEVTSIGPMGIIFKIKGKSTSHPTVLMSHFDVVPENGVWQHGAFSGDIIDDYIIGRGTLDTKGTLCAIMESVEHHLSLSSVFLNDLYLCFSGDEEVYGKSAPNIVSHLEKLKVNPALVLDEGGAVVKNIFPGVKQNVAVIGITEKGIMSLELTAKSEGGHASMPPKETAITTLSKAVTRLNKPKNYKLKITDAVSMMFDTLPRYSQSFMIRLIFANLWLFSPLVKYMAKTSGGELLSLMKTTQAFTMMHGSEAINVLPTQARIGINYRLVTHQKGEEIIKKITKIIGNKDIDVVPLYISDPPSISLMDQSYKIIEDAILDTFDQTITTPYLMMATTDSRHYHRISDHVYRFSPMRLTKEGMKSIHAVNEKIHKDTFIECVAFYIHLLQKLT